MESRVERAAQLAIVAAVLVVAILPVQPARADTSPGLAMWWKPTNGTLMALDLGQVYERYVRDMFSWHEYDPNMLMLDYPRTPVGRGTMELTVRFFPSVSGQRWCDRKWGTDNEYFDLPDSWYWDNVGTDADEFTWGIKTNYAIDETVYEIYFECKRTTAGLASGNEYHLEYQLGHCRDFFPCGPGSVYSDDTLKMIPRIRGRAPESRGWRGWFAKNLNYSMEYDSGSPSNIWKLNQATRNFYCDVFYPGNGPCYWFLKPTTTSSQAQIYYTEVASPSGAGTSSVYDEWQVRCSQSFTVGNCYLRIMIVGYNAASVQTKRFDGPWTTIPNDGAWWYFGLRTDSFPSGTVKWNFSIQGWAGQYFHVDYNQNSWRIPN